MILLYANVTTLELCLLDRSETTAAAAHRDKCWPRRAVMFGGMVGAGKGYSFGQERSRMGRLKEDLEKLGIK